MLPIDSSFQSLFCNNGYIANDENSKLISSNYGDPQSNTASTVDSIFNHLKDALTTIHSSISSAIATVKEKCSFTKIYSIELLAGSENKGKSSEEHIHDEYKRGNIQLNFTAFSSLKDYGFLNEYDNPEELSQHTIEEADKGICHGGVTSFIKDYLSCGSIKETAQKFEGGIPFEGFFNQDIVQKLVNDFG